jgi:hypothetical protein
MPAGSAAGDPAPEVRMITLDTTAHRWGLPFDGRAIVIGSCRIVAMPSGTLACYSTDATQSSLLTRGNIGPALYVNRSMGYATITFKQRDLDDVIELLLPEPQGATGRDSWRGYRS